MKNSESLGGKTETKAHIVCGVKTHAATAVEIHERNTNDSPLLPSLLNTTAENLTVKELSADKQYASVNNIEAIHAVGAPPMPSFGLAPLARQVGCFARRSTSSACTAKSSCRDTANGRTSNPRSA